MPPRKRSRACFPAPPTTHTLEVKFTLGPGKSVDPAYILHFLLKNALDTNHLHYPGCLLDTYASASVAGLPVAYNHAACDGIYNPSRTNVQMLCYVHGSSSNVIREHCDIITLSRSNAVNIMWSKFPDTPLVTVCQNPFASREPLGSFTLKHFCLPMTSYLRVHRVYATTRSIPLREPTRKNTWISSSNMTVLLLCVQRLTTLPKLPHDVIRSLLEPAVNAYQGAQVGTEVTIEFVPRVSKFSEWKCSKLKQHLKRWDRLWSVARDVEHMRKPELVEHAQAAMTRGPIRRVVWLSVENIMDTDHNIPFGPMQGLAVPS